MLRMRGSYSYEQLCAFPAVLHLRLPYQVSIIMSFFEQYRMGLPIIAPSLKLLVRWHMEHWLVSERTWDMTREGRRGTGSALPRHPDAAELPYDPNDDTDEVAVAWWLQWVSGRRAGERRAAVLCRAAAPCCALTCAARPSHFRPLLAPGRLLPVSPRHPL
jgi:hypothetical protein